MQPAHFEHTLKVRSPRSSWDFGDCEMKSAICDYFCSEGCCRDQTQRRCLAREASNKCEAGDCSLQPVFFTASCVSQSQKLMTEEQKEAVTS